MTIDYLAILDEFLHVQVYSGMFGPEEVVERALEGLEYGVFTEEKLSPERGPVEAVVRERFARKMDEEERWRAMTDCDRLTACFESLTQSGVLALENAGYTISDGWEEFDEAVERHWRPAGAWPRGGCFYHGQDLERALRGEGLNIAFSAPSGSDDDGARLGAEIVAALRAHGLTPHWEGSAKKRIHVALDWQRRHVPVASLLPRGRATT